MDRSQKFWDQTAAKYAKSPISNQLVYEQKLEKTRAYLSPDAQVLELGCGTGSTAILHAPFVKSYHAVDFASGMIEIAEKKAAEEGLSNLTFECADTERYSPPAERYDAVLALNVFHLLKDRPATLARIHAMLKPGGVLITSTACLGGIWWAFWPLIKLGQIIGRVPHVKYLSAQRFTGEIEAAGFDMLDRWRPEKSVAIFTVSRKPT